MGGNVVEAVGELLPALRERAQEAEDARRVPEEASKAPGKVTGRTERNEIVHLDTPPDRDLVGALVDGEITDAFKHSLHGTIDAVAVAALPERAQGAGQRPERRRRSLTMVP